MGLCHSGIQAFGHSGRPAFSNASVLAMPAFRQCDCYGGKRERFRCISRTVRLPVVEHIRRRFGKPVAGADVREGGSRVGMARKILEVDDVRTSLSGRGQCRDAEGMDRDGRVEAEMANVLGDQQLDRPRAEGTIPKSIPSLASGRPSRAKQSPRTVFGVPCHRQPSVQTLDGFHVERDDAFLTSFAENTEDSVFAAGLEVTDPKPDQFANPTGGIGEDGQDGPVPYARRRI